MKKTAISLAVLAVSSSTFSAAASAQVVFNGIKDVHALQISSALKADCIAGSGEKASCVGMRASTYTATNPLVDMNTVGVTYAHQLDERLRVGATLEGTMTNFVPAASRVSGVPMVGFFANWSQHGTVEGPNVRLSAARQTTDAEYVNELGLKHYMKHSGMQLETNTGVRHNGVFYQPYAAIRTTEFVMFNPANSPTLALKPSRQDTVLAGLRGAYGVSETVGLTFALGIERDLAKRLEGSGANERTRYVGDIGVALRTGVESQVEMALSYADQAWNDGASTMLKVGFKQAF